ncbi:MAG: ATP-binding protein [Methylococcaceae bacterium]|nr:ATP-binding protein [Methylococcaceae bacterium]
MRDSLSLRLLVSASVVLAAFFGIAGAVLESAFIRGAEQATWERLQVHIYALLSAANLNAMGELTLPERFPEARFSTPGSGLYGAVFDSDSRSVWRSRSAIGIELKPTSDLNPGRTEYRINESGRFVLYYPLTWEDELGVGRNYLFIVAEDTDAVEREISGFSGTLWRWLGGIGLILVVVQVGVLGWSLRPVRSLARDIEAIEVGTKERLDELYPREFQGVVVNINALLDAERSHLDRYRKTLSNLAHSLKTPLAILRGCCNEPGLPISTQETLGEQISRMDALIEYQLQRAGASGKTRLTRPIAIRPVIEKLIDALRKVHASKAPDISFRVSECLQFACEEGDLLEIAGNLIDNACKWCRRSVRVSLDYQAEPAGLQIVVEDDGPGIPEDNLESLLRCGARADDPIKRHGIGLAVVRDLVQISDGRLEASISELGGLKWTIWLPGKGVTDHPDQPLSRG